MIKIYETEVFGWKAALRGMRNPMNSWERNDSYTCEEDCPHVVNGTEPHYGMCHNRCGEFCMGENDHDLAMRLRKAGSEHRKFLRMIHVQMDVVAPLYWWAEADTYKVGTVRNSCSKMHKIMSKPFEVSDFSFDRLIGYRVVPKQEPNEIDESSENWVEFDNGYSVSDQGRIRNDRRGNILNGSKHSDGYLFVTIYGEQIPKHRIVAAAFCDGASADKVVNHKDGNKLNNAASNLEWVTQSENVRHAVENGFASTTHATYRGKLPKESRDMVAALAADGMSRREIACRFNVSHTTVNSIVNGKYKYSDAVNMFNECALPMVAMLNELRDEYINEEDLAAKKEIWYSLIQMLPESYNQRATIDLNYEVLTAMYHQRKGHKLDEWNYFCEWVESLPYSELITGGGE